MLNLLKIKLPGYGDGRQGTEDRQVFWICKEIVPEGVIEDLRRKI